MKPLPTPTIQLYLVRAWDARHRNYWNVVLRAYSAEDAVVQWAILARRALPITGPAIPELRPSDRICSLEPIDEKDERLAKWRDADGHMHHDPSVIGQMEWFA